MGSHRAWIMIVGSTCIILVFMYLHLASEINSLQVSLLNQGTKHHLNSLQMVNNEVNGDLEYDKIVVIYNRVPKTGSTSFIGLAYDLCYANHFNVIHINTSHNSPTLSLSDQMRFVYNVSNWVEKKPTIYHGHMAYIDFSRFGVSRTPIYVNIVRKPLDRLISYYYFLRYGDDLRPYLVRRRQGDKMTLDECVKKQHSDCSVQHMWIQIPFFCGQHVECWNPGSSWALDQAKHNLIHGYFLVGVTEEMDSFVALLEYSLPRFFKGAFDLYLKGSKSHLRKTVKKMIPSEETISKLQSTKVWQLENEFYNFALEHFHSLRRKTLLQDPGSSKLIDKGVMFNYGKIKPKT